MTGEVDKRYRGELRNWLVLAKAWSLIAALAVCLVVHLGTAPRLRAAPQENASGSNSERVARAPVITAKPERCRAEGALVVLVAVQLSVLGLYLPPHRAKAWDQDSPLARSGVASKRLQLLADTRPARRS
jgi:hypothetical protein